LKDRIDWGVQAMKLESVVGKRCMECSKGFKQRVSLAAALIHDPKYILLDEPTVGLDPLQIFMVRDFLKLVTADKIVLFSSHILQEVAAMTQRVIIIYEGRHIADISFTAQDNRTERLEQIFREAVGSGKRWYEGPEQEVQS
jgi:ABC-2 type transport system ATP-binding protein